MKFLNKLFLRKRIGALYADYLPPEIRYRNRAGDELSDFRCRRAAMEEPNRKARECGALSADRMTDIPCKESP